MQWVLRSPPRAHGRLRSPPRQPRPEAFLLDFHSGMLLAPMSLGVVGVFPALVSEAFMALRELIFVDVLEELFGIVGKSNPRAEEAQADYARLALAIGVLKLHKSPAHYPLQPVVRLLRIQQDRIVAFVRGDYLLYLFAKPWLHPLSPLSNSFSPKNLFALASYSLAPRPKRSGVSQLG